MGVSWKEHTNELSFLISRGFLNFHSNGHSNFEGMLFWKKDSNLNFLNFSQLGFKFKLFVNWFHCTSAFKVCRFVCILWTSKGTPIINKEGLGLSFSIRSCEVGVMAKMVAKSQIDNVILDPKNLGNIDKINSKLGMWYNIGKVSYKTRIFLLKPPQSKLVCENYGFKKGESTLFLANERPFLKIHL